VLTRNGQAIWYESTLAALPAARTYQVWGLSSGQVVSLGLMGPDPRSFAAFMVGRTTTQVMVTAEPAGGTTKPTTPVLAVGVVPANYVS
jgi:anti-sigma-K factor RskA